MWSRRQLPGWRANARLYRGKKNHPWQRQTCDDSGDTRVCRKTGQRSSKRYLPARAFARSLTMRTKMPRQESSLNLMACLPGPLQAGVKKPWMVAHPRRSAPFLCVVQRKENSAMETAMAETVMTPTAAPKAPVIEADRRPVKAVVGVVRPATPIRTATRVVRRRISNGVAARIAVGSLARRAPGIVVIGTGGLKGLAAVF